MENEDKFLKYKILDFLDKKNIESMEPDVFYKLDDNPSIAFFKKPRLEGGYNYAIFNIKHPSGVSSSNTYDIEQYIKECRKSIRPTIRILSQNLDETIASNIQVDFEWVDSSRKNISDIETSFALLIIESSDCINAGCGLTKGELYEKVKKESIVEVKDYGKFIITNSYLLGLKNDLYFDIEKY